MFILHMNYNKHLKILFILVIKQYYMHIMILQLNIINKFLLHYLNSFIFFIL